MGKVSMHEGWIRLVKPSVNLPSLKDNTADADRVKKGIEKVLHCQNIVFDLELVKSMPSLFRKYEYEVSTLLFQDKGSWHLIDLYPSSEEISLYLAAVDLGTSSIAVRFIDFFTQEVVEEISFTNPQNKIGSDVLTRIHFASQGSGLGKLQCTLLEKLNKELKELAQRRSVLQHRIVGMSVAGNTTMTHLFLGLDPYWICREPYIPAINTPEILKASELGLQICPQAPVLVLPNAGSYLGGDLVGGILASGMAKKDEISILVDVGTNAELVVGNSEWLVACAGAAGPALEGGVASIGMMACPGVIDRVRVNPESGEFSIRTIENKPPVGICGSGLIDLVAQLFMAGMIDVRGKFVRDKCGDRLRREEGLSALTIVYAPETGTAEDLTLNQSDIDSLLRSKAAMYTIIQTILEMIEVPLQKISDFYIGGTFGSYIDPRSAVTLGMIPDLPLEIYKPLGNTSLAGAEMALLSAKAREKIYNIRDRITYVELNVNQQFMNLFNAARFIPHTDTSLFPSVRVRLMS